MVNIFINNTPWKDIDSLVIPLFENSLSVDDFGMKEKLKDVIAKGRFKGLIGETTVFEAYIESKLVDVTLLGLGNKDELDGEEIRRVYGRLETVIENLKLKNVVVSIKENLEKFSNEIVEGLTLGAYRFNKYKSNEKDYKLTVFLESKNKMFTNKDLEETKNLCNMVYKARDLVNEPSNIIYPETLGEEVKKLGQASEFQVDVLDVEEIEILGMYSFLSVGKGSDKKPKVIVMRYFGDRKNAENVLGLVGKGLTYDAGGYSLKDSDSMATMKADMAGSAVVATTIGAIAKMKLKINVVGVIAACENVIAPHSYKPGEIINSMSGKTIEVVNTDAEGRLTLCDAVTYIIEKENAKEIIDVATLTNTVNIALGKEVGAIVTNSDDFYNEFNRAVVESGEKMWRMPNYNDYKKYLKSDIADIKNYGHKYGKVITAGLFVGEFVEGKPWIHLDIAGPSYADETMDYCIKGGTGFGVRTLYKFI